MMATPKTVNLSGYKFVPLVDLELMRDDLKACCDRQKLKGTILLSEEGINCFIAGSRESIDQFLAHLKTYDEFADFEGKESYNTYPPFSRMLVKIKKEIIAFGLPEVQPAQRTSKKLSAAELKLWLDEGRDLVLLDTRNAYEVELGTFDQAEHLKIDNFREFPEAVRSLPENYRSKPVVMFCTGGIRCEKAGPFLEAAGFQDVLQLDGGILKYFEQCGGDHWHGECFVFDKRVALDPELAETATTLCYVCQAVLNDEDQRQATYRFGVSCPHCYREIDEECPTVLSRTDREKKIVSATHPLPGSFPYENVRPMSVSQEMDGLPLLGFLRALNTHLSESQWVECIAAGQILHKGKPVTEDRQVLHGQKYYHLLPETTEPVVAANIEILFEDFEFVVINKPAPLPMHPCGRFNKNSLQSIFHEVYQPDRLRLVHRLDANTSGIVVYARNKQLATALQEQFGQGRVEKEYWAGVYGKPPVAFESTQRIGAKPAAGGTRLLDPSGKFARTEFQRIPTVGREDSLLRVYPKTGRTHQIRLHLWDLGFPVIGDPAYLREKQLGVNQALSLDDPPMQLHAARVAFDHPVSKVRLEFSAPEPQWVRRFGVSPSTGY
ncbi:MAG: pseudouridine synthase [Planctomycetota bacterium]|nr:pseudouridine synthase [Planctomycetota bacterium]